MAGSTVPLAFAVLTFTWAYLATQTSSDHSTLQVANYILTYISAVFTGFLSYSYAASGENPAQVLGGWNQSFYFILILVVAFFLIKILNAVLEATGKEVL